jgi:cell wall-associated NlpC family hydrolase
MALLTACAAAPPPAALPAHAVIGVDMAHLDADFWIRRAKDAQRIVLDRTEIQEQNQRLVRLDRSIHDLENLSTTLPAAQVQQWIEKLSRRPAGTLFDEQGRQVEAALLDALVDNLQLETIPASQPTRFGMVVQRADLRSFPSRLRVFSSRGDTDIDRFQESALFPGTPVAIVHASRDDEWRFVVSTSYAAWIEKAAVAEGHAQQVFAYTRREPFLVVTGATARTVFTPEQPQISELQLEMGVRVPVMADWPADRPVNGQHPYAAYVIELPLRAADGTLRFTPALLPKTADVANDYLPLNRANLLRQSFKFLGERYGWGHSYNARDCSGFVSEVYRSFGIQLPRNTRDQGVSPALNRLALTEVRDSDSRIETLRSLQIGDLVYIPGHVMMVIGQERGMPYVIHDTTGISYRGSDGSIRRVALNGVSVTPLEPLLIGEGRPMFEHIYSVQRIRH